MLAAVFTPDSTLKFVGYSLSGETPFIPFVWCEVGAHKTPRPPNNLILCGPVMLLECNLGKASELARMQTCPFLNF
jgi:hypothetical protein